VQSLTAGTVTDEEDVRARLSDHAGLVRLLDAMLDSRDRERGWDRGTHALYIRVQRAERLAAAGLVALPSPRGPQLPSPVLDQSASAVAAHGLLTSLATVVGAAETLIEHDDRLETTERCRLLEAILRQGRSMEQVVGAIARGLPSDVFLPRPGSDSSPIPGSPLDA
jgi:signal transduction histidine kinase